MQRAAVLLAMLFASRPLSGYSVLTHEAIVDSAWDHETTALIKARFPSASEAELLHAHAEAYAGAIIQDLGYYPFGNRFFSDLTHYVRSGDFVTNLLREACTVDEYAFALGALAHYAADTQGHGVAVNRSVALAYPRLARKYGASVTYADDPGAHLRVEFGFDVLQVARGNYAPQAYHDFIGFAVAQDVLQRAFRDTYSLAMDEILSDPDLAIGSYRYAVSSVIPAMTRVAWSLKKDELGKLSPAATRRAFVYNLSRAGYRREWGRKYRAPGTGTRILAFLIRILPKIGPLKALTFPVPTAQTESLFQLSFDRTMTEYRRLLAELGQGRLVLPNRDFDTGAPTKAGEYRLADESYARLARELAARDPAAVDAALRAEVIAFCGELPAPPAKGKAAKSRVQTAAAVEKLRGR